MIFVVVGVDAVVNIASVFVSFNRFVFAVVVALAEVVVVVIVIVIFVRLLVIFIRIFILVIKVALVKLSVTFQNLSLASPIGVAFVVTFSAAVLLTFVVLFLV